MASAYGVQSKAIQEVKHVDSSCTLLLSQDRNDLSGIFRAVSAQQKAENDGGANLDH